MKITNNIPFGVLLFLNKVIYLIMVTEPMCRFENYFAVLFVFYTSNCLIVKRRRY